MHLARWSRSAYSSCATGDSACVPGKERKKAELMRGSLQDILEGSAYQSISIESDPCTSALMATQKYAKSRGMQDLGHTIEQYNTKDYKNLGCRACAISEVLFYHQEALQKVFAGYFAYLAEATDLRSGRAARRESPSAPTFFSHQASVTIINPYFQQSYTLRKRAVWKWDLRGLAMRYLQLIESLSIPSEST